MSTPIRTEIWEDRPFYGYSLLVQWNNKEAGVISALYLFPWMKWNWTVNKYLSLVFVVLCKSLSIEQNRMGQELRNYLVSILLQIFYVLKIVPC